MNYLQDCLTHLSEVHIFFTSFTSKSNSYNFNNTLFSIAPSKRSNGDLTFAKLHDLTFCMERTDVQEISDARCLIML